MMHACRYTHPCQTMHACNNVNMAVHRAGRSENRAWRTHHLASGHELILSSPQCCLQKSPGFRGGLAKHREATNRRHLCENFIADAGTRQCTVVQAFAAGNITICSRSVSEPCVHTRDVHTETHRHSRGRHKIYNHIGTPWHT